MTWSYKAVWERAPSWELGVPGCKPNCVTTLLSHPVGVIFLLSSSTSLSIQNFGVLLDTLGVPPRCNHLWLTEGKNEGRYRKRICIPLELPQTCSKAELCHWTSRYAEGMRKPHRTAHLPSLPGASFAWNGQMQSDFREAQTNLTRVSVVSL